MRYEHKWLVHQLEERITKAKTIDERLEFEELLADVKYPNSYAEMLAAETRAAGIVKARGVPMIFAQQQPMKYCDSRLPDHEGCPADPTRDAHVCNRYMGHGGDHHCHVKCLKRWTTEEALV